MSDQNQENNTFRRDIKLLQEKVEKQEKEIEALKKQVRSLVGQVGN